MTGRVSPELRLSNFPSALSSARATSRSVAARLRDFDSETETLFLELEQRNRDELDVFDRQWLLDHDDDLARTSVCLAVRDLSAREALQIEQDQLTRDRFQRRDDLLKAHTRSQQTFFETRRRARAALDPPHQSAASSPLSPDSDIRDVRPPQPPATTRAHRPPIGTFYHGRLIESHHVEYGRFQRRKINNNGDRFGNLLDPSNLQKVLESTDSRTKRKKVDQQFKRGLDDMADVRVSRVNSSFSYTGRRRGGREPQMTATPSRPLLAFRSEGEIGVFIDNTQLC
jgi:hypothetical protein